MSVGLAMFLVGARLAVAADTAVEEEISLGRPLEEWATEHGHAGKSNADILSLAKGEKEQCSKSAAQSEACEKLSEAISLVDLKKRYRDSDWRCSANLESGDLSVLDGEIPHWMVLRQDDISLFNVSFFNSKYVDDGWGRVVLAFYEKGSKAPFERLEIVRTPEKNWGLYKHHVDFGEMTSRRIHRALAKGAKSIVTAYDKSGKLIKVVETSLFGYAKTMRLCGLM